MDSPATRTASTYGRARVRLYALRVDLLRRLDVPAVPEIVRGFQLRRLVVRAFGQREVRKGPYAVDTRTAVGVLLVVGRCIKKCRHRPSGSWATSDTAGWSPGTRAHP